MEVTNAWSSLLPDLLLDILHRLEATTVLTCAGVCKPWRRSIISNASVLRPPRPDRFLPSLLLGFIHGNIFDDDCVWLRRTPAPSSSQPVLPEPTPITGIPAGKLLTSRDGFVLVKRRDEFDDPICLWNPIAGTCTFLPMPSPSLRWATYVLLRDYDDLPMPSSSDEPPEVRILAVQHDDGGGGRSRFRYQLSSATSGGSGGAWGPVERSQELLGGITAHMEPSTEVVCHGGTVHWLSWSSRRCTVALDVGTGRTWTTELPRWWNMPAIMHLVTSGDGRLSVIRSLDQQQEIQVWILAGDEQWFQWRELDVRDLVPDLAVAKINFSVRVFCPRSGCLLVHVDRQQVLVDVDSGTSRRIQGSLAKLGARPYPYEMDWSSYWTMCLSKMKSF